MATLQRGDVLIRGVADSEAYELVDAVTYETLATGQSLLSAVDLAAARGGAIWRQNTDYRGRVMGEPLLLLPRSPGPKH